MTTLSLSELRKRGACPEGLSAFHALFGESEPEVTEAGAEAVASAFPWRQAAVLLLPKGAAVAWREDILSTLNYFTSGGCSAAHYNQVCARAFARHYRRAFP